MGAEPIDGHGASTQSTTKEPHYAICSINVDQHNKNSTQSNLWISVLLAMEIAGLFGVFGGFSWADSISTSFFDRLPCAFSLHFNSSFRFASPHVS